MVQGKDHGFHRILIWLLIVALTLLTPLLVTGCAAEGEAAESASVSSGAASAPAEEEPAEESTSATTAATGEEPIMVEITMKDGGVIRLALDKEAAPLTVENFVNLVEDEYYDGLIFHRIIEGFMIQGGDPTGTGMGGPGHTIKGEFASNGWENNISHQPGVISMARSGDPDSAGSQFFITHGDATFLDGDYAAFGRVVEGMDVVDRLATVDTDGNDRPLEDVVIETIRIVPAEADESASEAESEA